MNNAKEKVIDKELIAMEEEKEKKDLINESGKKASNIHERGEKKINCYGRRGQREKGFDK